MTTGLEELFFEKAIIQGNISDKIELLKQADYYAKLNQNYDLTEVIHEKLNKI
ncbi:hypothetical protein PMV51_13805 [Enterococcus avium]|uniref:hypothetical protein n=1 Tax=Enterococcus avium TaxID=33945 RepID=UPI00232DE882|nr:hypothetical protein [Enterococcus avium]MDB1750307.1 hypothetical protein [Enterococcus avium]MDB1754979.1 hypothetical protein [Enterococcus avium]MDB1761490.1 hypothetical protein [Enterococcus avium]